MEEKVYYWQRLRLTYKMCFMCFIQQQHSSSSSSTSTYFYWEWSTQVDSLSPSLSTASLLHMQCYILPNPTSFSFCFWGSGPLRVSPDTQTLEKSRLRTHTDTLMSLLRARYVIVTSIMPLSLRDTIPSNCSGKKYVPGENCKVRNVRRKRPRWLRGRDALLPERIEGIVVADISGSFDTEDSADQHLGFDVSAMSTIFVPCLCFLLFADSCSSIIMDKEEVNRYSGMMMQMDCR